VLRYRVAETDTGFAGEEGSFTICSFWLVSALAEIGELRRARGLCEKLLSFASPLGLYAEEIDPHSGRHLGNFPQAFTHLALINAVMHVIRSEEGQAVEAPLSPPRTSRADAAEQTADSEGAPELPEGQAPEPVSIESPEAGSREPRGSYSPVRKMGGTKRTPVARGRARRTE